MEFLKLLNIIILISILPIIIQTRNCLNQDETDSYEDYENAPSTIIVEPQNFVVLQYVVVPQPKEQKSRI